MPDFVGKCELGDFRRDSGIVVDESDDSRVQTPLGGQMDAIDVVCVALIGLANTAGST